MPPRTVLNIAWLIVASLFVALLLPIDPCLCANDQGYKTLVLTQVSDIGGHVTSYINERAVKVTLDGSKVYLVSSAPTWKVVFCNGANKKAVTMSLAKWLGHIVQMTYAYADYDRFGLALAPKNLIKRYGRNLRRFVIAGERRGEEVVPTTLGRNGEYLVIEGAPVAEQACFIWQKALSCPKVIGVPVSFVNHGKEGKVVGFSRELGGEDHWLTTSSIEERVMPINFFAYPADYAAVGKEAEVIDDNSRKEHVDNLVKDLFPNK